MAGQEWVEGLDRVQEEAGAKAATWVLRCASLAPEEKYVRKIWLRKVHNRQRVWFGLRHQTTTSNQQPGCSIGQTVKRSQGQDLAPSPGS